MNLMARHGRALWRNRAGSFGCLFNFEPQTPNALSNTPNASSRSPNASASRAGLLAMSPAAEDQRGTRPRTGPAVALLDLQPRTLNESLFLEAAMQRFSELEVWRRARALAVAIYRETRAFPEDEKYGMTGQLRRAGVSVPANIAEGARRQHRRDFVRFLNMAGGSLAEIDCLLILCGDLAYLDVEANNGLREDVSQLSRRLISLRETVEAAERRENVRPTRNASRAPGRTASTPNPKR